MTNDKAIVIIDNEKPHCGKRITFTEEEKCEAFEMAIEALRTEPCEDVVSRDSALKALCYACSVHQNGGKCSKCNSYNAISDLPPAAPSKLTCEDVVSREAVLEITAETGALETQARVKSLPHVTPKQKIGKWIKEESIYGWDGKSYQCSVCGRSIHLDTKVEDLRDYPYCHCGARMEGESE